MPTTWTLSYNDSKNYGGSLNARLPTTSELYNMINLNGYNSNKFPIAGDLWVPVFDKYNDWMQVGDARLGGLHCDLVGCPNWGLDNSYTTVRRMIALVCLDKYYWN